MKILQIFLYLATVFLWTANLNAQYLPVSMETKIANAEIIVEGRISGQQFFESKGEFFTENLLEIKQVIKGKVNTRTISVVTLGGELDGTRRTWTHLPSFSQNEYGVFFLTPTKYQVGERKSHLYEIFSGSQGYYRISNYDGKIMAVSAIETFDSLQDLYQALGETRKDGNESPFEISGNKKNCIKIKIVPKFDLPTGEENPQFVADIFVKSTGQSVKLHSINVIAKYDTIAFGNNLVNANNLSFTEGDLVTNYYSLDLADYSPNQLKLNYAANGTQFSSLETIRLYEWHLNEEETPLFFDLLRQKTR